MEKYDKRLLKILRGSSDANISFDELRELLKVMFKYETIIYWSEEDKAYLAEITELPGCMAHGDAYESALANAKEAIDFSSFQEKNQECMYTYPVMVCG